MSDVAPLNVATSAGQPSRYAAPISQMFADPDVVDFFVAEAASANVTSIRVVHGLAAQAAGRTYGATTYNSGSNSGSNSANSEISWARLVGLLAPGTSTNISIFAELLPEL